MIRVSSNTFIQTMSIQLVLRRLTKESPLLITMSLLRSLSNAHIKFSTEAAPSCRGVATEFLLKRCGLTEEDITKAFRRRNSLLDKSNQNFEQVLELLNGCGLTTPIQIRRVVLSNPKVFFCASEINVKSKLSWFRTFMKEDDISKLISTDSNIFNSSESRLKTGISLLQRLGFEGNALSELLGRQPRLAAASEESVMESIKLAEDMGFQKGSKKFANALRSILGARKESLDRRLQCLSNLGFSEKQISELWMGSPWIMGLSEERLKRHVDFVVKSAGLTLADLVSYRCLFSCSLERRIIPRYRVIDALKSMQLQVLKREAKLPAIVYMTEKRFLEIYVDSSAHSSVLRDIYHGVKVGKLITDKEM